METRDESRSHLNGAGRAFQFMGTLGLFGSIAAIVVPIVTGESPPFLGFSDLPGTPVLPAILLLLMSATYIYFGESVRHGSVAAAVLLTGLSWVGVAIAVVALLAGGSGCYEAVAFTMLAVDGHASWFLACRLREES